MNICLSFAPTRGEKRGVSEMPQSRLMWETEIELPDHKKKSTGVKVLCGSS
jgi:hypothetical protein